MFREREGEKKVICFLPALSVVGREGGERTLSSGEMRGGRQVLFDFSLSQIILDGRNMLEKTIFFVPF